MGLPSVRRCAAAGPLRWKACLAKKQPSEAPSSSSHTSMEDLRGMRVRFEAARSPIDLHATCMRVACMACMGLLEPSDTSRVQCRWWSSRSSSRPSA
jgi:hypothetical protein